MSSIDPRVDIGHVHLKVADIERALAFYCRCARVRGAGAVRGPGGVHLGGRVPPPHRPQHVGVARRNAASSRPHRALPRCDSLPGSQGARRRASPPRRCGNPARRRIRPRRERGVVSPRSRRQRPRALLGPAEGGVAARRTTAASGCSRVRSTSRRSSKKPTEHRLAAKVPALNQERVRFARALSLPVREYW